MRTSEQINEIATAAAKAQLELQPAVKDSINPAFRSKYANEAAIREASRVYAKHGIAIFQEPMTAERGIAVTTMFAHSSGQWIEFGPLTVPVGKPDAHGVGSATTYAKRYALSAAAGIAADEDDDGNAASASGPHARVETPVVPDGFADWWDDMSSTADSGTKALQDAWKKSAQVYRDYTMKTRNDKWEAIKSKAAKVKEPVSA